ncbi:MULTISPECIES: hypothetical protein [Xanthomonas]|uniref:hypothetical protein n=1 Tax=Xanthomonas TaxID=338 RepID=UPI001290180F|nr:MULTISPECIES: hypothetical protein [Xanthomonas]
MDTSESAISHGLEMSGKPWAYQMKVDKAGKFAGRAMDSWAYENGVELDFFWRSTATDNTLAKSFNGRGRSDALNDSHAFSKFITRFKTAMEILCAA